MNIIKKIDHFFTQTLCFFFFCICIWASTHTMEEDDMPDLDFFINDPLVTDFIEQTNWHIRSCSKQDAIDFIEEVGLIALLEEEFFLNTNPLNTRNIIDQPFNLLYDCSCASRSPYGPKRDSGFHLFYNQTTRMVFRRESTNIDSYLGIRQKQFLCRLRNVIDQIKRLEPFDLDADQVIMLFSNLTVQERKLGFMFYGKRKLPIALHGITIGAKIPFYLLEHNYFLTEAEREAIEDEFGAMEPGDQRAFEDAHFVTDQLGLGDARITVDIPITRSEGWAFSTGAFATIPTAVTFAHGIIRGNAGFDKKCPRPFFDLKLFCDQEAFDTDEIEQKLLQFLLDALDHISSNLLDTPMGNGGHFGLGIAINSKMPLDFIIRMPWARNFRIKSRYSLEYLIPKRETRYFVAYNNRRAFDKRDFFDPNQADDNFRFLTCILTDRLFPLALNATVHPNIIFRSTSRLIYKARGKGFMLGTDTWVKTKESFGKVCSPRELPLNKQKAHKPFAYQGKLLGSLFFKKNGSRNRVWTFSLYADATFSSTGIGEDFTLAFKVNCSF